MVSIIFASIKSKFNLLLLSSLFLTQNSKIHIQTHINTNPFIKPNSTTTPTKANYIIKQSSYFNNSRILFGGNKKQLL